MLALDIATKCGYAYNIDNYLFVGTIEGDAIYQLDWIHIKKLNTNVCIERLTAFNSPNPSTLVTLAQRVGYITYSLMKETDVRLIATATWRSHLKLKNSKVGTKELQKQVNAIYGNTKLNLDEVDALGVWLCGMNLQVNDLQTFVLYKCKKLVQPIQERLETK